MHRAVDHQGSTKTSKNKSSTLIYQLCSVSPPVTLGILGICHEPRVHAELVLQVADGVEQCIALLFTIVYCLEHTKQYWDTVCLKTLSPGFASVVLVTSWSLAVLITQPTATALLSCRNASCGFRIVAEPAD